MLCQEHSVCSASASDRPWNYVQYKKQKRKKMAYTSAQLNKYVFNADYVVSGDVEMDKTLPHDADLVQAIHNGGKMNFIWQHQGSLHRIGDENSKSLFLGKVCQGPEVLRKCKSQPIIMGFPQPLQSSCVSLWGYLLQFCLLTAFIAKFQDNNV